MSNDVPVAELLASIGIPDHAESIVVAGGADALLWRVTIGANVFALRLLSEFQHEQAHREVEMSAWVNTSSTFVTVPEVIRSGTWNNRPVYLMHWIEGTTLAAELIGGNPDLPAMRRLGEVFGATQARIHAIPPPSDPSVASARWMHKHDLGDVSRRIAELPPGRQSLLHLDYHPLNVMIHRGDIVAVLDWANAGIGDPGFDLARTEAIIQLAPLQPGIDLAALEVVLDAWKVGYERAAGPVNISPIARWWAGAFIEHDLSPRVGNPAVPWLNDTYMERVRNHTAVARQRALASE